MQDDFNLALAKALKKLKASDRFESEVRSVLHEYEPDVIDQVIVHLRTKGILSDERAVQAAANSSRAEKMGAHKLAQELQARGAPAELLSQYLPDTETERTRIRVILNRKFGGDEDRAKAGRFLVGRGFTEDVIEQELATFFGEED